MPRDRMCLIGDLLKATRAAQGMSLNRFVRKMLNSYSQGERTMEPLILLWFVFFLVNGFRHEAVDGRGLALMFARRRVAYSARFGATVEEDYFRRGFLIWLRPEPGLLKRFAFAATRFRYSLTILSPEAPAIRLAVALAAASIFSRTISSASRRAFLPPFISLIILRAITPFASAASIIKELNIRRSVRRSLKERTLYISPRLSFCRLRYPLNKRDLCVASALHI